jgi:hypothetical protein
MLNLHFWSNRKARENDLEHRVLLGTFSSPKILFMN